MALKFILLGIVYVAILIIGIILTFQSHTYSETVTATILENKCTNNECILLLQYIIDKQEYKTQITLEGGTRYNNTILIQYDSKDPNNIRPYQLSSKYIGIIFIVFSIICLKVLVLYHILLLKKME